MLYCSAVLVLIFIAAIVFFKAIPTRKPLTDEEKEALGEVKQTVTAYAEENGLKLKNWPDELLLLLARNPETEQFVLDYPSKKDLKPTVDISDQIDGMSVPLFLQWDERWGYKKYGDGIAGLTGCGPVCLSMAAVYLLKDPAFSPDKIIDFAAKEGYYSYGSGSKWTLISEGAKKLGLYSKELPLDETRIKAALAAGHPVICAMGPGNFTSTGHFIVLTGMKDGGFTVNDPNSRKNSEKIWTYEEISGQIRNLWELS